jgi:hypothetical protein
MNFISFFIPSFFPSPFLLSLIPIHSFFPPSFNSLFFLPLYWTLNNSASYPRRSGFKYCPETSYGKGFLSDPPVKYLYIPLKNVLCSFIFVFIKLFLLYLV